MASTEGWLNKEQVHELTAEAKALAAEFAVVQGRLVMPKPRFASWRGKHRRLTGTARKNRLIELLALVLRLREVGTGANEAIAQLLVLISDLMNDTTSAAPA